MNQFKLPRGTKDFLPVEAEKTTYVEYLLQTVCHLYGYKEIRTPIFEETNLFTRSVGEASDIVNKEMYTFLDKGNRSMTLRPEGTAGVIRAFVENKLFSTPDLPVKLYYKGPVFRYERPQTGRYRQINQFGYECLGIKSPLIDAELIFMVTSMLFMLGLKDFKVNINSIGDTESRANYSKALKNYFEPHLPNLCPDCQRRFLQNPLRILDCKVDGENDIVKKAPLIKDFLNENSINYFNNLKTKLEKYKVPFVVEPTLVRGLDYYTDTVFEIHAKASDGTDFGAIGAGGRYDRLVEEIGGPATPGIGMAFGVDRLVLLLDSYSLFQGLNNRLDTYVMPLSESTLDYSLEILMFLRANGFKCEMDYSCRSIKSQFKTIERNDIPIAILIGEDEMKGLSVIVKNTKTKEQVSIGANKLLEFLDKVLSEEKQSCHGCQNHNEEEEHHCCCGHNHDDDHDCGCGDDCQCENDEHDCQCGKQNKN